MKGMGRCEMRRISRATSSYFERYSARGIARHIFHDFLSSRKTSSALVFQPRFYSFSSSSSAGDGKGPRNSHQLLLSSWSSKSRVVGLGIIPIGLLVFFSAGLFLKYNDERRAIPKASEQSTSKIINRPAIGGPFRLIDFNENPVSSQDFIGGWTLIYFGYTFSPDVVPNELKKLASVIDILEMKKLKINPVFMTVDPSRDSPSHLHVYLQEFHNKIIGLTGSMSAIRQVAQEYRVYFKKSDEEGLDYLIESSNNMYLMDPKMEFVRIFGQEYTAMQLANEIENEMKSPANKQ